MGELRKKHASSIERDFEARLSEWRSGKASPLNWIAALQEDQVVWDALKRPLKGRLLRTKAASLLDRDNPHAIAEAKVTLLAAARFGRSDEDERLRALIAYFDGGTHRALRLLRSPRTRRARELKAALLLETHEFAQAWRVAGLARRTSGGLSTEALRLRSLCRLAQGRADEARALATQARSREPHNAAVRFTHGVSLYYSALSKSANPRALLDWPFPNDWALAGGHRDSNKLLAEAADEFGKLADLPAFDHVRASVWQLAALANHPERQRQAAELASRLSCEPTPDPRAMTWVLARGYEADLKRVASLYARRASRGSIDHREMGWLVTYLSAKGSFRRLSSILEAVRIRMARSGDSQTWRHWAAIGRAGSNPKGAARAFAARGSDFGTRASVTLPILRRAAVESGKWQPLLDELRDLYHRTKDPLPLIDYCQTCARLERWNDAAVLAPALLESIATVEAYRLAVLSLFNSGRTAEAASAIEKFVENFSSDLPTDLLKVRSELANLEGDPVRALADLKLVAAQQPTPTNCVELARQSMIAGDFSAADDALRDLLRMPNLTAVTGLQGCTLARMQNARLASKLWLKANSLGISDGQLGQALELAADLGLDDETKDLVRRLPKAAQTAESGIELFDLSRMKSFLTTRHEHVRTLAHKHLNGGIPIHLFAQQTNRSLVDLIRIGGLHNEGSPRPLEQFPLMMINAARGHDASQKADPDQVSSLVLDLTSVVLLEHLEVLNLVADRYKKIVVPHEVIPALLTMRDQLREQKVQREMISLVGRLIRRRKLHTLGVGTTQVEAKVVLVDEINSRVDGQPISCGALVKALRGVEALTAAETRDFVRRLGREGRPVGKAAGISVGAVVVLGRGVCETLGLAGVLATAVETFTVGISAEHAEELLQADDLRASRLAATEWLNALIEKVGHWIRSRAVEVLAPIDVVAKGLSDASLRADPTARCLVSVLQTPARAATAIVVDDRNVNALPSKDGMSVLSSFDIVSALNRSGALSKGRYFGIVQRLRKMNVSYVPALSRELDYYLRSASISGGVVIESEALRTLRTYFNAALTHGARLQVRPIYDDQPIGEARFAMNLLRAVSSALRKLWFGRPIAKARRETLAKWLRDSLFFDHATAARLVGLRHDPTAERNILAMTLSSLLVEPLLAPHLSQTALVDFLAWVSKEIVEPRIAADPKLAPALTKQLHTYLAMAVARAKGVGAAAYRRRIVRIVLSMPEQIKGLLTRDLTLMGILHLPVARHTVIGAEEFASVPFWRAAESVINGGGRRIVRTRDHRPFVVRAAARKPGFTVAQPSGQVVAHLEEPISGLLSRSRVDRELTLASHADWFDSAPGELQRTVHRLAGIADPADRLFELDAAREKSFEYNLAHAEQLIQSRRSFKFVELIPPHPNGVQHHLRIADKERLSALPTETAGTRLATEMDALAAIRRLRGLPVALPSSLIDRFVRTPFGDQRRFVAEWLRYALSPVSVWHLIRLLGAASQDGNGFATIQRGLVRRLPARLPAHGKAFHAFQKWMAEEIAQDALHKRPKSWSPLAASWIASHRLYSVLVAMGAKAETTEKLFVGRVSRRLPAELFDRDSTGWTDVSHPSVWTPEVLAATGLAYATDGSRTPPRWAAPVAEQVCHVAGHSLSLLKDMRGRPDSLGSFLALDKGAVLARAAGTKIPRAVSFRSLDREVVKVLGLASTGPNSAIAWFQLSLMKGGATLSDRVSRRLVKLVARWTPSDERDVESFRTLQAISTLQIFSEENVAFRNFRTRLRDLAIRLEASNSPRTDENETSMFTLLDAALAFSLRAGSREEVARHFSELLAGIVAAAPRQVGAAAAYVLNRLSAELPTDLAKHFWPILLKVRATPIVA